MYNFKKVREMKESALENRVSFKIKDMKLVEMCSMCHLTDIFKFGSHSDSPKFETLGVEPSNLFQQAIQVMPITLEV